MADHREQGITLGELAKRMQDALHPVNQEISRLEQQRKQILTMPSLLVPGAVAAGDQNVELGIHELNQDILQGNLDSFAQNHPESAAVDISGYIPGGEFKAILPGEEVTFEAPPAYDTTPLIGADWRKEQTMLVAKYPFLSEFFAANAIEDEGQRYIPRKYVKDILVHKDGKISDTGEEEFLGRMQRELLENLGDMTMGKLLHLARGKGIIAFSEKEMVLYLSFIDQKNAVYGLGDPSLKKKF